MSKKTNRKLDRSGDGQTLQGIVGDDVDDLDIFGYEMIYTTGEFRVDREAFIEKARQAGIAEWMLPSKVTPYRAFGRAMDDLLDGLEELKVDGQRVQFDLRTNDSRSSRTLEASVFFPADMVDQPDGKWVSHDLGVIKYDDGEVHFVDRIEEGKSLHPYWAARTEGDGLEGGFKQRAETLFELHQESHTGKDVNNMTYYLVDQWTDSISLRDACYFVPANHTYTQEGEERGIEDLIDAFSALYKWLNAVKQDPGTDVARAPKHAQDTELHTIEIMDTDRQRSMVETKVQQRLREMAGDMTGEVLDSLQEDETTAKDVASEVEETLDELAAIAGGYDDLLDGSKGSLKVQKAVERAMNRALSDLDSDEEELVEAVLDQAESDVGKAPVAADA